MADNMNYRTPFEYPHPNRKTVSLFLRAAKTPAERKVWRDLLNSGAFHKEKSKPVEKKEAKKASDSKPKKK